MLDGEREADALRQAVNILSQQLSTLIAENAYLKALLARYMGQDTAGKTATREEENDG